MLKIYNTLSGEKEIFKPLKDGKVGMYVCGVTVYDLCHIGHARSALVFDVIRRYLIYKGFDVTYVKNFTDVDDKIIERSRKEGVGWKEVTERYIKEFIHDMELLNIVKADVEPRATEHIDEMERIIERLIEDNFAYRADGGDVYYRVKSFKEYGKLSKRNTDEMVAGARIEVDERKENPLDFALWKSSKSGEPAWDSPWGSGRPGWHIECSAMSMKYLGAPFDIHGGGKDLIFPHHENEIAQSEAYSGKTFARYWIHNGFVNINQEKMSKSLGNFFTIREVFEKYPYSSAITAEVLRYFLLSTHYRSPVDFSDQAMHSAHAALDGFYDMFIRLKEIGKSGGREKGSTSLIKDAMSTCRREFQEAMDDDFNTAASIGCLQKLRREANSNLDKGISEDCVLELEELMKGFGDILGIFSIDPSKWEFSKKEVMIRPEPGLLTYKGQTPVVEAGISDEMVDKLIAEREECRRTKNWKRADEIRNTLQNAGIIIEDRPDGSTRIKH